MLDGLKKKLRERRYGEPIVIVSGLPRSGTSMMMGMLEAGGVKVFTDGERTADIDNPKGYYEYERVKDLEKDPDRSWVARSRGQALKVISFLLKDLPDDNDYRIIFMRRHLDEVLASQEKMVNRLGTADQADPELLKELYRNNIVSARLMAKKKPNMELIEINYRESIDDPKGTAAKVNAFLGGKLDEAAMADHVDRKLYRNRVGKGGD